MKNFWQKLGLHKIDEMEQYIIFKAQRNAYFFLITALIGWTFYESYKVYTYHSSLNPFPCMLLSIAVLIQIFSQLVITRNAVKDNEDSYEREPLIRIIILICIVCGLIATVTTAIILLGTFV